MFWNTTPVVPPACTVCGADALVHVVDPKGNDLGPHCSTHADERVNVENFPLRKKQNTEWKSDEAKPNEDAARSELS